jgi:NAD(P)-dependent dehydrogenase (short-subunit alcohol dehydrogenase family)
MGDRTAVVTGASDGIGAAAARALHGLGLTVVVVGRSAAKTNAVADELGAERHVVDFTHLQEVRELSWRLTREHERIDVLINNAGLIASSERVVTDDGHELTFQINHLAPFLLTVSLRPLLVESGARVITTSSAVNMSKHAHVDLTDLDSERAYSPLRAYATSKLENVMFTHELARRWGPDGVTAAAVHPGLIRSRFGHSSSLPVRLLARSPLRLLMRSPEQGADTIVWLATNRPGVDWESGGYYSERRLASINPQAGDLALSAALWERSAEQVGVDA